MTTTLLFLKNGFRFQGTIISENQTHLIIQDCRIGRTEISKEQIMVRNDSRGD